MQKDVYDIIWITSVYHWRKFRSQTSISTDETAEVERIREDCGRRSEKSKGQKKEGTGALKSKKDTKHFVFANGLKIRLAKAAGAAMWSDERWKTAPRCGTKHISKSTCTKHISFGAFLEFVMFKWWAQAAAPRCAKRISISTCWKHLCLRALLEIEMFKTCTPLWREDARSAFRSQIMQSTPRPDHFWRLRCRNSARRCSAKHIC